MKLKILSTTILILFFFNYLNAQVTSSFSTDVVSGCSPLKVTFTNNSSGTNLVNVWNFGNGNSSSEENPQAIYTTAGTYTVSLSVSDGSSTDESILLITVFANPIADFSADDTQGCTPFNVQFQNTSTIGDAPIEKFNWDFRAGFIDNRENPTYLYTSSGFYDVFLEVVDTNNCKSFKEEQRYIEVVSSPSSIFSMNPNMACSAPSEVTFTNYSSGTGTLNYAWDFGDDATSTDKNPIHMFSEIGDYNIKLTVNSEEYGCSTSTTQLFQIKNIVASGVIEQNEIQINNGDLICPGEINYTNTSTGSENVYWLFGDGDVSFANDGKHVYKNGGNYTIMLIAEPNDLCADTMIWNIEIDSVNADFSISPENSCASPTEVMFSDSSTNAVSWLWKFNDGTTSTLQNPTHSYSITSKTDEYALNKAENFITELTVESAIGCTHSKEKGFIIKLPTSIIHADKLKGCTPLNVNFSESSISDYSIIDYKWIFGDGQTDSGETDSTSHIYTTEGEYEAKLVITNSEGCTDTSYRLQIDVGKTLSPDFSISSDNVCQNEVILITQNMAEAEKVDIWKYSVNGVSVNISDISDFSWPVNSDTGYVDINLKTVYNGCESEITKTNYLFNNGPIADFDFLFDCQTPFDYEFIAKPKKYNSFKWDFGDGTSETTELNPLHTFPNAANRKVKLMLTNGACADTFETEIKIRQPNASITSITNACAGDSVIFKPTGSYESVEYCFEKYFWTFNDTSIANIRTSKDSLVYSFEKGGEYNVNLITYYDNGCYDTATHHIQIFSPELKFELDSFLGCAPVLVTFIDSSKSYVHNMKQWNIDFGDGIDSSYTSQVNTFNHIYTGVGGFDITFSITDSLGCSAEQTENIYIGNPSAHFNTLTNTEICAGNTIMFGSTSQNNDSVIWNFGDGAISYDTANFVAHQYDSVGHFQATLVVFEFGCSDTFKTSSDLIKVQEANAFFSASDTLFNCYPKEITFNHIDLRSEISNGRWEFGYKDNSSEYDTIRKFIYPIPGEYIISLDIETTFGCEDKFERKILISGPQGNFDINPDTACKGTPIVLSVIDTSNVYSFEWDLGDGRIVQGDTVTHIYNQIGNVYPKLILQGDSLGNCIPPPFEDTLYIFELKADIGLEDSTLCEQTDIIFSNSTFGHSEMLWDFGDGNTSVDLEPTHNYLPGNYTISLIAQNNFGCKDTIEQTVIVNSLPEIFISEDTLICFGGNATIHVAGGNKISWFPTNNLSDNSAYIVEASPDSTITYTAIILDTITGCENSDDINISVQQIPDVSVSPQEASLIVGEQIQFEVDSLPGNIYKWSPEVYFDCINCANAIAIPTESSTLTLNVKDINNCFTVPFTINVTVDEQYSVDVPKAFTPNGDGNNDIIYVNGWGIKKLISFRIYNRWGNEVFFSEDLSVGWNGIYNGKLQNVDTYVYVVEVETYAGTVIEKKGTITLLQ